jgi:hypothetical protein
MGDGRIGRGGQSTRRQIRERFARERPLATTKDGVLLANSGHFDVEIDVAGLRAMAVARMPVRDNAEEYLLPGGQRVYLLAEGRLVGQAAAEASPAAVMDLSFSAQALGTEWLVASRGRLDADVRGLPPRLDDQIARLNTPPPGGRGRSEGADDADGPSSAPWGYELSSPIWGDAPPSMTIVAPVMNPDASEARKMHGQAISSTLPQRPMPTRLATVS